MNTDEIKQKIDELDEAVVKDFMFDLYLQYPELSTQIETLVLINDPAAFAKAILKRIQSISRGRKFIDYHMNQSFARDLYSIVVDIEAGLLDTSPKHAFDLVTKFLATANKVYNRSDDSSGNIGDIYQSAVLLWLTAAKNWKDTTPAGAKINWRERVYDLYCDNDYAVYDLLLPNSAILLSHDELTKLAWRYESELRQALKAPEEKEHFNLLALNCSIALRSVAKSLKDSALYERATLIYSPTPNDLEKQNLIKMHLQFNQLDEALRWLNAPWEKRFEHDRLRLLDKVYGQKGDARALKQTRYQIYLSDKTYSSFTHYFECLNENEKQNAKMQAIQLAEKMREPSYDIAVNIDLLLRLNEVQRAQKLVLANPQQMANVFYDCLLKLAKQFEEQQCWLAATTCYRSLLWDILNQARYKAYTHAARYYKKLALISKHIKQYTPLEEHEEFIKRLNEKHGRKSSFWQRVL